ncbi:helix-hairpin-helix domain-containing protein [Flexilinea flocculi]|jgi:competence protein ComEA|uniref:Competence protein ComEA helix-hairpin-helix repeat region n=1 Tax=Flexilinea flocculi TaxID=1678840 RepID=A0A0S7BSA8_9CHLR|nr:helix-hairpin-helix domain-containing protein [Flexilinea flocculi]NMB94274.1 transporter [Flexilinea flocculi]GAP41355.1 competence protein ComEA helix-hairpin-helix repeat region [Flexilinea flocculi]
MNKWYPIFIGIILGFLFSGIILLISTKPKGKPIIINNNTTPISIHFEVYGAVKKPGVYSAALSIRVQDAVALAGGLKENADLIMSNLSAKVFDGDRIIIPTKTIYEATITPQLPKNTINMIHLNSATIQDLMTLPGIGETKAKEIIRFREVNGSFDEIADLLNIPGIGEKTIEQFLDRITVE